MNLRRYYLLHGNGLAGEVSSFSAAQMLEYVLKATIQNTELKCRVGILARVS